MFWMVLGLCLFQLSCAATCLRDGDCPGNQLCIVDTCIPKHRTPDAGRTSTDTPSTDTPDTPPTTVPDDTTNEPTPTTDAGGTSDAPVGT